MGIKGTSSLPSCSREQQTSLKPFRALDAYPAFVGMSAFEIGRLRFVPFPQKNSETTTVGAYVETLLTKDLGSICLVQGRSEVRSGAWFDHR